MDDNSSQSTHTTVSRETPDEVSRETGVPSGLSASLGGMRTAADIAASAPILDDAETPLARAAEHSVLARASVLNRPAIPRPDVARVFVVANQKGGVGKTTSTVNLAAGLAQLGQRVLVIDLDPQGNASTALGVPHPVGTPGTYEVIVDGTPIDEVAVPCPDVDGVDVVPATIDLAGAEIELVPAVAREFRLKNALAASKRMDPSNDERWDYIFIDCPPSLGLLTINALTAGSEVLIPIQAEYYALEGLAQLLNTVELARKALNPAISVSSMLITMYDSRTRLAAGVAEQVRDSFGDIVLKTYIPRSVRVSEAPSSGESVMTYDPGSPGALSYLEAARELALKGTN
jgi:chromosome partitioning protein